MHHNNNGRYRHRDAEHEDSSTSGGDGLMIGTGQIVFGWSVAFVAAVTIGYAFNDIGGAVVAFVAVGVGLCAGLVRRNY